MSGVLGHLARISIEDVRRAITFNARKHRYFVLRAYIISANLRASLFPAFDTLVGSFRRR